MDDTVRRMRDRVVLHGDHVDYVRGTKQAGRGAEKRKGQGEKEKHTLLTLLPLGSRRLG